jgi:hypothetical protein
MNAEQMVTLNVPNSEEIQKYKHKSFYNTKSLIFTKNKKE